jgi:MEMO1 family protein
MRRIVLSSIATSIWIGVCAAQSLAPTHRVEAAGRWYPSDKVELNRVLNQAFETAEVRSGEMPRRKSLRALVVPHAGLQYSGFVAASAYRLAPNTRNVIVLAFSHLGKVKGLAAPAPEAYETPLGAIPVNHDVLSELGFPLLDGDPIADHSLENQLPFIQWVTPKATVTPVYVGSLGAEALESAAKRLAERVKQGDLILASSDFTHFGESYGYVPFPPGSPDVREKLNRLAMTAFEEIGSIDVAAFDRHLSETGDTICGRDPIRLLLATLALLEDEVYVRLADYLTSGDLLHDYTSSVGYGALAFYPSSAFRVSARDERKLLDSARSTLAHLVEEGARLPMSVPPGRRSPDLEQRTGVFVTVKTGGTLRGCIGSISPRKPLWDLVADRTIQASSADPRFKPIGAEDEAVSLEVSVLTPMKRILNWGQFRLGHGALLKLDGKAGLLLPQLAEEYDWNERQFLENLSRKAGLPAEAYKTPHARLYVYQAQVIRETESEGANGAYRERRLK